MLDGWAYVQLNFSLINSSTSNMHLNIWFSCFLFSQFGLLLPLIEKNLKSCLTSMLELFAKLVKLLSSVFSYFTKRKHFKNYEEWFLFHLKRSFRSRDIHFFSQFFALSFYSFQIQRARWNWNNYDVVNWLA